YGVVLFFLLRCTQLVRFKSFCVAYITPIVPYRASDWKDFMIRMPLLKMKRLRKAIQKKDSIR
ncbi:spore germination protein, partial [Clostridium perfringens]